MIYIIVIASSQRRLLLGRRHLGDSLLGGSFLGTRSTGLLAGGLLDLHGRLLGNLRGRLLGRLTLLLAHHNLLLWRDLVTARPLLPVLGAGDDTSVLLQLPQGAENKAGSLLNIHRVLAQYVLLDGGQRRAPPLLLLQYGLGDHLGVRHLRLGSAALPGNACSSRLLHSNNGGLLKGHLHGLRHGADRSLVVNRREP